MTMESYKKKKSAIQKKRVAKFVDEKEREEQQSNSPKSDPSIFTMKAADDDVYGRFLPQKNSDSIPRIKLKRHFLVKYANGKKKYLSWTCRKTINEENYCPADEHGSNLWNDDEDKFSENNKKAAMFYRKDNFVANFYIIDNPNNPEDNGKVFKYPFGKTIDRLIQQKITTKRNKTGKITSKGIDIFCPIDGVNFTISCSDEGGNNTYKDSTFDTESSCIVDNNKEFDSIMDSLYDLDEIYLSEDKFLSEEEVQKRFNKFIDFTEVEQVVTKNTEDVSKMDEVDNDDFNYDDDDNDDITIDELDFEE